MFGNLKQMGEDDLHVIDAGSTPFDVVKPPTSAAAASRARLQKIIRRVRCNCSQKTQPKIDAFARRLWMQPPQCSHA